MNTHLIIKRIFDLISGLVGLIIFAILFLIIAIITKITSKGPVFFKQTRLGRNCKLFLLYKFRTMTELRDETGNLLPDEERLTKIGNFLRRFKLDELPEFWNVLKGEMSLVGPRPTIPKQIQYYNNFQNRRLLKSPGMTGWAQINGNTILNWDKRIILDVWYVDHCSLLLDLYIMIRTLSVILFGEHPNERALEEAIEYANYTYRSC